MDSQKRKRLFSFFRKVPLSRGKALKPCRISAILFLYVITLGGLPRFTRLDTGKHPRRVFSVCLYIRFYGFLPYICIRHAAASFSAGLPSAAFSSMQPQCSPWSKCAPQFLQTSNFPDFALYVIFSSFLHSFLQPVPPCKRFQCVRKAVTFYPALHNDRR